MSQMIMGAGKTSTILPLLALMLADGSQLMVQVVPNPLLAFTRNLMRSHFSSVVAKAVYTFHFERATEVAKTAAEMMRRRMNDQNREYLTRKRCEAERRAEERDREREAEREAERKAERARSASIACAFSASTSRAREPRRRRWRG